MALDNPCMQCGACCAFFRVSFYWEESSAGAADGVPSESTTEVDDFLQCMKGTNQPNPHCVALTGKIGEKVGCKIYSKRSSTCRDFGLHLEDGKIVVDGENLIRCNEARKAWNLPPLTRSDLHRFLHYPPVRQMPAAVQIHQHSHK